MAWEASPAAIDIVAMQLENFQQKIEQRPCFGGVGVSSFASTAECGSIISCPVKIKDARLALIAKEVGVLPLLPSLNTLPDCIRGPGGAEMRSQ